MESDKKDIRSMSEAQLREFFSHKGLGAYRGTQVHQWLWQKGASTFDEMTSLPRDVRAALAAEFSIPKAHIPHFQRSSDGTIKNAIELPDGLIVESVLIPAEGRTTLCVSCQVGCAMGCAFCATARLKRTRDLSAGEIYDQVLLANSQSMEYHSRPLSNIVFMGMGEPTMNYTQVMRAIELITSDTALGMSVRRITVSTVGNARMIHRMADDGARFHLAVSLHWAIQEKRRTIMPIAESVDLDTLLESLNYWYSHTKDRITLEYVIWEGLNDHIEDVKALIAFCRRVPCKVNLIEYNDIGDSRFKPASRAATQMYIDALEKAGITTVVRYSKGRDIDAACGQLAGKKEDKK